MVQPNQTESKTEADVETEPNPKPELKMTWLSEPWTPTEHKIFRKGLVSGQTFLCTTRFSNETYAQNRNACRRLKLKCFYCNPYAMPSYMLSDSTIYVLEMNNETNQIMGIGKIVNLLHQEVYRVYDNDFYNQTYYAGHARIDRAKIRENTPEHALWHALEHICFRGRNHLKRGYCMTSFPHKILGICQRNNYHILDEIKQMFAEK